MTWGYVRILHESSSTPEAKLLTTMCDCQVGAVVHTDDTLKGSKLDAIILFWLPDFLQHFVGLGQIDSIEFGLGFNVDGGTSRACAEWLFNIHVFSSFV